jgi:enoyl-CoA hydratase/carnithine racemase
MSKDEILLTRHDDGGVVVSLNRPGRRNAVNFAQWRKLGDLFAELGADRGVRAVILTGTGGHFCAGADISEFKTVRADAAMGAAYDESVRHGTQSLIDLPKPTIAAIAGYCIGGGVALALACDFRVAVAGARFGIPAARLGIVYSQLECESLIATVGVTAAKRILFGAAQIDAAEAARIGLIDRLAEGDPVDAARDFAEPMAQDAPLSIAGMKTVVNALAAGKTKERHGAIEAAIETALNSEDYREGVRAFGEKRPPRFTGR